MGVVTYYDTNGVPQPVDVTDGAVHVLFKDAAGNPIETDDATWTLQTIDYEHHEIHAGSHFFYTDAVTLANAAVQDYLITTPDTAKWAHLIFSATGSAITTIQLYEGSDKDGTTPQTIFNSDRNSLKTSVLTLYKGKIGRASCRERV